MRNLLFIITGISILLSCTNETPVSQWRGHERNGYYDEQDLLKKWPDKGPELLWSAEGMGDGYSSVSVTRNMIYVTGKHDSIEKLTATDHSGQIRWQVTYGNAWEGGFPEAKSTPFVEDNRVYVISTSGEVVCIDSKKGDIIWSVDAYRDFGGYATMWGVCESPLVVDDKVFYTPAGMQTTMIALDKNTGDLIWASESLKDSAAYVSPIYIKHNEKNMIVNLSANYLFGVDPENGQILWKYKYYDLKGSITHPYHPIINTNSPLYHEGQIYLTKGYDHLAAMFELNEDGTDINLMWTDSILDVHIGGAVLIDGFIYGANTIRGRQSMWCCLEWGTGGVLYEEELLGKGAVITADDMIYFYGERRGEVALIKPSPKGSEIISVFTVSQGTGPHWAHPVIRDGVLYIRHGDAIMAYHIKT